MFTQNALAHQVYMNKRWNNIDVTKKNTRQHDDDYKCRTNESLEQVWWNWKFLRDVYLNEIKVTGSMAE